jgi:hypothetical protein
MNNRTKAAVIGGIIAGVLSGIPIIGGCCFLWALAGGFLALFMYIKGAPGPMEMGDAAKLGATTGVIGAVIATVIRLPLTLLGVGLSAMGNSDMPNAGFATGLAAASGVLGIVLTAVFVVAFAVLGAVIGAATVGKKGPGAGAPPPPPPGGGYGGPGTPGGGTPGGTPGGGYGGSSAQGSGGGYGQGM